jgi:drug/metabolite transporter (DMT)-like permease
MPLLAAIAAILIWSSLATLGVSLAGVPPLFVTGAGLFIGGCISLPWWRHWSREWRVHAVGVYGLFAYHLLYILALRNAPPVSANLIHYVWPLLIVLMAPLASRRFRLTRIHVVAAVAGFLGVALAAGTGTSSRDVGWHSGYALALLAAVVWASYSVAQTALAKASTADVGPACLVSGALALLGHAMFEPAASLSAGDTARVIALGLGPMGCAFYLWSYALRRGDPRLIGVLANATPLLSTTMLVLVAGNQITPTLMASLALVSCASLAVVASSLLPQRTLVMASEPSAEVAEP